MSEDTITINLKITKDLYEKLEVQLKLLKDNNIHGLENAETVEDLIIFYLEHFSAGEEKMKKIEDRMQSVLDTLRERGVDVLDLFNSFNQKVQDEKEEREMESRRNNRTSPEKKKS
ncbi:hypothetical protein B4U78_016420 [Microbacterium esteraromaticum]|uniref:Uncharacterized protein n=1 Tax=Mycoplasma wenyonii TaxID=65123 RepID=A0A328PTQ0_9MOLU|nr:hypothetical protein [Mycoplasma wenyonii]PYC99537.1 hypothetical protein B4U78_016420 [Microbacterium esteraromaticum]RAO94851.1 hypothetical protein DNK47_02855 [Mycoplasma wenyonii]